ncbi:MAG: rhomboid family intramembrane serine protease [Verrucomicrobiae bacterium]|nr:rhomboid family intramembrane serine protease [Verrucomicrobiae bacterium]
MNWLDQLERRLGRYAIPGLVRIVIGLNALVWVLLHANREWYETLTLDPERVMQGEVWRLVSYLFIPPAMDAIWLALALYFLWIVGEGLEQEWGAFKLNVFYFTGMIATTAVAFFIARGAVDNRFLNLSLFLAFATVFPEFEVLLFFVLPVKVKWLGWLAALPVFWSILSGPLPIKLTAVVSLGNYLLFFAPHFWRTAMMNRQVLRRRAQFEADKRDAESETWHRCVVCGKTERDDPNLEFRVADDDREYCMEHLGRAESVKRKT